MRRLLLSFALAAPLAAAVLAFPAAADDGTLAVRNGDGRVWVNTNVAGGGGVIIGQVDRGSVALTAPTDIPGVHGCEDAGWREDPARWVCSGRDLRVRLSGRTWVRFSGVDIDLSVVARGFAQLDSPAGGGNGGFSLNGTPFRALPDTPRSYELP